MYNNPLISLHFPEVTVLPQAGWFGRKYIILFDFNISQGQVKTTVIQTGLWVLKATA